MATFDFFISHSSGTKELARLIYYNAWANNLSPWYDEGLLQLGDDLKSEIERGITSSSGYLLLHCQAASLSTWVKYEMRLAKLRHQRDPNYRLRVVKLDNAPLSTFWRRFLYQQWNHMDQPGSVVQLISALTGDRPVVTITASAVLSASPSDVFVNATATLAEHSRNFVLFYFAHVKHLLHNMTRSDSDQVLRDSVLKILGLSLMDGLPSIYGCPIPIAPGVFEFIHATRMRIPPKIVIEGLPDRFLWTVVQNNEIASRIEIREVATGNLANYPTPFVVSFDAEL
jgi:TIR domain